jgi:hypothetical protein
MKNPLIPISITLAKVVIILSRLTGHKSSSMPGKVARIVYPKILTYMWNQIKKIQ